MLHPGMTPEIREQLVLMAYTFLNRWNEDAARMMKVHLDRTLNYFTHHITNARAEWTNSKIALIEKMTYGYWNKDHLKTAI